MIFINFAWLLPACVRIGVVKNVEEVECFESEGGGERIYAEQFLRDPLADGPLPTRQIKADADGDGYSWATVRRAQKPLGISAIKGGMKEGWTWRL